MKYTQENLEKALTELSEKYPDETVNNSKSIGASDSVMKIPKETYSRQSMKRSNFKNLVYQECIFENIAFTESCFHAVTFSYCNITGSSFACCNFFNSKFIANKSIKYKGNNFSQSNFTSCEFMSSIFKGSGFLQTLFHKCKMENSCFKSCTMEGSQFVNCQLKDMDFGNANTEFIELVNTSLNNVIFPFYQLPYIIGIFGYEEKHLQNLKLRAGKRLVTMSDYQQEIDNLILYYMSRTEYFPVCNLLILKKDIDNAIHIFLDGINESLHDLDFRMIRHFCRLAKHHNLVDELTARRITKILENHLTSNDIPPERLNECIIHMGEIRKILLSGNRNSVTLNLDIRTNICKKNLRGMQYVNSLCDELNTALSQNDLGQTGFEIAISNHSPYEVVINIICGVASVAAISEFIWKIVDNHKKHKDVPDNYSEDKTNLPNDYVRVDTDVYQQYVNARIDQCKEQLLHIKKSYSGKKMNKYIEEITQKLKTDLDDLYEKDIMIFKKINH